MNLQCEMTSTCNFRCTFCPQAWYGKKGPAGNTFGRPRGNISDELWDLCLQNAQRHASTLTLGFFGEQMMHPKFSMFLEQIPKKRAYRTILFSNWSLATHDKMKAVRHHIDDVRISLDASNRKLFNRVRPLAREKIRRFTGPRGYGAVQLNLEHWLEHPQRPPTTLMYTMSSINQHDVKAFLALWLPKLRRTDRIVTKRVLSYGGVTHDKTMTKQPCRVPHERRLTVAWNGDITPCNLDVDVALRVGNLERLQNFVAVMAIGQYHRTIKMMKNREGICANCPDANNHTETTTHWGTR